MNNQWEELDTLVRDLTQVGSISKSEARRRILDLLASQRETLAVEIERMKEKPNYQLGGRWDETEAWNKALTDAAAHIRKQ